MAAFLKQSNLFFTISELKMLLDFEFFNIPFNKSIFKNFHFVKKLKIFYIQKKE
jgi:hypothetical protein